MPRISNQPARIQVAAFVVHTAAASLVFDPPALRRRTSGCPPSSHPAMPPRKKQNAAGASGQANIDKGSGSKLGLLSAAELAAPFLVAALPAAPWNRPRPAAKVFGSPPRRLRRSLSADFQHVLDSPPPTSSGTSMFDAVWGADLDPFGAPDSETPPSTTEAAPLQPSALPVHPTTTAASRADDMLSPADFADGSVAQQSPDCSPIQIQGAPSLGPLGLLISLGSRASRSGAGNLDPDRPEASVARQRARILGRLPSGLLAAIHNLLAHLTVRSQRTGYRGMSLGTACAGTDCAAVALEDLENAMGAPASASILKAARSARCRTP